MTITTTRKYKLVQTQIDPESDANSFRWSQNSDQTAQVESISIDTEPSQNYDWWKEKGSPFDVPRPPETVPAVQALGHAPGVAGVDYRPHLEYNGQSFLLDSGSQASCCPIEPGDQPIPGMLLKAANGTKIQCFGYKKLDIKIG